MEYKDFCKYLITDYYKNREVPSNVTAYTKDYPKGYSRTMLKAKFGVTVGRLLEDINPDYIISNCVNDSCYKLANKCKKLNIQVHPDSSFSGITHRLKFICNTCSHVWETSASSIYLSTYGCPKCAGNLKISDSSLIRILAGVASDNECELLSADKDSISLATDSKVLLRCINCESKFTRGIRQLYYRLSCICPTCYPSKAYNMSYNGVTFSSKFELECYKILEKTFVDIEIHKKYKDIVDTTRKFTMDFLVNKNIIIEVSSYNKTSEYFKEHSDGITEKQNLVLNSNYKFFIIRSLPELETLIANLSNKI